MSFIMTQLRLQERSQKLPISVCVNWLTTLDWGYTFWLLVRITAAARSQDFIGNLAKLNIEAAPDASTLQFISRVSDTVHQELCKTRSSGDFAEIASLALRTA